MKYGLSAIPSWFRALRPPPKLTVSEWADANRMLPETSAARGAHWRTSTAPYLAGIMNVVHEPGIRAAALMKCAQSGGSEALNNILGYHMEHDPCPMLLVHPTAAAAQAYSKERLSDMIRTTPALRRSVQTQRILGEDGRPESTLDLKMFPGGFLALGGANTPNTFARWSVRLAIGDDCDRFPPVVGDEGDPGQLLAKRTTTFHDRLVFFVSTPTLKGGRIDSLWERSDKRRYHVRCPRCGRIDYLSWSDEEHFRVVFTDRDPATARIECPDESKGGCGWMVFEPQRAALIASGHWLPTTEPSEAGLTCFHVPAMLSPWVTLRELVDSFLVARASGRESFKVWVNTMLGEAWDDRTSKMEASALMVRIEDYGELPDGTPIEVPAAASVLTAGVDVQASGFFFSVYGWGPAAERWVVDRRTVPGDPTRPETQAALLEALGRSYQHTSGHFLGIQATCIDSGYASDAVYGFVLQHQARRIYATKGDAGKIGQPLVWQISPPMHGQTMRSAAAAARARKLVRPVTLYHVNVDDGKAQIMASLALAAPGPNFVHFPARVDTIDAEFFAQFCAEHKETRYNRGGVAVGSVWVQDREANHALDEAVLALVAFRILRPNLRVTAQELSGAAAATPTPVAAPAPHPDPAPSPPPSHPRRIPWIGRRQANWFNR